MNQAVADIADEARLQEAVLRLVAAAPVEKIILFGSRARGDHDDNSDYDLCVILTDDIEPGIFTPVSLWEPVAHLGLPIQIAPMRRSRFEIAQRDPASLSYQIARDGRVIYDAGLR